MIAVYIIIGIIIVGSLIVKVLESGNSGPSNIIYSKKKILSESEQKFYLELKALVEDKYLIFPQIQLSKLVSFEAVGKDWIKTLNQLNQKSVDYVLVDKVTFETKLVIELDDFTHSYKNRQLRDQFVEDILKKANMELLRTDLDISEEFKQKIKSI
jgi:hypothetical protein